MNEDKVKTVVVEKVPEDVWSRYKAACAMESMTMRADLIAYMTKRADGIETELFLRARYEEANGKPAKNASELNTWIGTLEPEQQRELENRFKRTAEPEA